MITLTLICMSIQKQSFTNTKLSVLHNTKITLENLQGSSVQHEEPPPDKMNNLSIVTRKEDPNTNLSLNILPTQEQVRL